MFRSKKFKFGDVDVHKTAKAIFKDGLTIKGHKMILEMSLGHPPFMRTTPMGKMQFDWPRHLECECGFKMGLGFKRPRIKKHKP